MKYLFLLSFAMAWQFVSYGQYNAPQNMNWHFGQNVAVSFTTGSPVVSSGSLNSYEGSASVSDATGQLLFYTDGTTVYDRTGAIMPTGAALTPYITSSATQGALIVPVLANANQYYIFSTEEIEDYMSGDLSAPRIFYSIVDMTLNSGFGDVVASSMGTLLATPVCEKAIAIPGNACNMWVLIHARDSTIFYAYNITSAGISSTPVVSHIGTRTGDFSNTIGVMKISPDRTKLIFQSSGYTTIGTATGSELYDFDANTGIVSNCRLIDSLNFPYGAEFSPDNTKLYMHYMQGVSFGTCTIAQYDLSVPTTAAIAASEVDIATGATYTNIRLAPDGKIYLNSIASPFSNYLDCISSPNTAGTGCNYIPNAVPLAPGSSTALGLPNLYMSVSTSDTVHTHMDTIICSSGSLHINAPSGTSYNWFDGSDSAGHTFSAPGSYWVTVSSGCGIIYDTIKIHPANSDSNYIRTDISECVLAAPAILHAPAGCASYLWNTGATTNTLSTSSSGICWVAAYNACGGMTVDTFHVLLSAVDTVYSSSDTLVCAPMAAMSLAAPAGFATYSWNTGETTSTITVTTAGTYVASCISGCNMLIDTNKVATTPSGTVTDTIVVPGCLPGTTVLHAPPGYLSYHWQDGSAGLSFVDTNLNTVWLSAYGVCDTAIDTFHIRFRSLQFSLGNDTSICIDYKIVAHTNMQDVSYMWQDGSTENYFYTNHEGAYYCTVNDSGCLFTDTINIAYYHLEQNIPDTFICKGTPFSIDLKATVPPNGTVLWDNGSSEAERTVADSGTYWVYVRMYECEILDTIHVVTGYCNCWSYIPDAFTPNDDGKNDIIKPFIEPGCTISGYLFSIYNRWGQQVFSSDVRERGWDGTFNGVKQEIGTYVYTLQFYAGVNNLPVIRTGDISLLR